MTQRNKTVSVVIATHNGAEFVDQQVRSILEQTRSPVEIIVSDDASTDETVEIVRRALSTSSIPWTVIRNETALGFRDNFLRASRLAKSDFIAFCDQDDIWESAKLERCARYFDDAAVALIVHSALSFDSATGRTAPFTQGITSTTRKPPLSYDPWMTFFGFSMVFRRELLRLWDLDDRFRDFIAPGQSIAHDRWIMFLAQVVGVTIELDIPLVRYRQHASNLFGDGRRMARRDPSPIGEIDHYLAATGKMIEIVRRLPDERCAVFPAFDRAKSAVFFESALRQLEGRRAVYVANSRLASLSKVSRNLRTGLYRSVHAKNTRWRSVMRDLKFGLTGL